MVYSLAVTLFVGDLGWTWCSGNPTSPPGRSGSTYELPHLLRSWGDLRLEHEVLRADCAQSWQLATHTSVQATPWMFRCPVPWEVNSDSLRGLYTITPQVEPLGTTSPLVASQPVTTQAANYSHHNFTITTRALPPAPNKVRGVVFVSTNQATMVVSMA